MEGIGKELQKEREARGISLKDISLQTKIGLRHLEAIESDRLDLLPGGFFTRQILKAYISSIGLKPEDWLPRYDLPELKPRSQEQSASRKGGHRPKEPATENIYYLASRGKKAELEPEEKRKEPRLDKIVWVSLSVIVLGLFIFLIYLSIQTARKNGVAREASEIIKAEVTIPAERPPAPAETTTAEQAVQSEPVQGLQLELNFDEDCWIQVYADGNLIVDGLKLEGFRIQIRAEKELLINLGNAGGVSFRLNGQPGKPLGKRGAVIKNIRITTDNWSEFLDQSKAPE